MTSLKSPVGRIVLSILIVLFLGGCAGTSYETVYPTLSDGKYDSEFPYRNCSDQLEDIAASLVQIDVLVFYETYSFSLAQEVTYEQIKGNERLVLELSDGGNIYSESVGGTAITIYNSGRKAAFLSCAHILDYPDTVVSYYPYPDDAYIKALGIKARQKNSIARLPGGGDLRLLASDRKADIALLGQEIGDEGLSDIRVFNYPLGDSEELEWGSFVYIMGFPLGHAMITRGIVSDPERIRKGSFLIDAVFNRGFSGGPVIAVRDGVPNFEMVGMVRSAAATDKYYLTPSKTENLSEISLSEPYNGELQLVKEKDIKYGITFSVTSETLRDFYKLQKDQLEGKGYYLQDFFLNKR